MAPKLNPAKNVGVGHRTKILKDKAKVYTKATYWKIPHNTRPEEIHLKLGRYNKERIDTEKKGIMSVVFEGVENENPKSELTLDEEEFKSLIEFLQEEYEPFRHGAKAFIPLDTPFEEGTAEQIRSLFTLPETSTLLEFINKHNVIPDELLVGLEHIQRLKAVERLESMLEEDLLEKDWQSWFEENDWVLGSDYVRTLDERDIDTNNISDFLMEAFDGFLDIVEIKRPEGGLKFWASTLDHGNYVPSSDLIKAITQSSRYIYEIEREANSVKFLDKVDNVRTIKPKCTLIFGRSFDWNDKQREAFRILNASYHNLTIMTYDHVLARAKRIVKQK